LSIILSATTLYHEKLKNNSIQFHPYIVLHLYIKNIEYFSIYISINILILHYIYDILLL
jgi:hypothetical protein